MKAILATLLLVLSACGGSESKSCSQSFRCTIGACTCQEPSNMGQSCCDPNSSTCTTSKCDLACKVCS